MTSDITKSKQKRIKPNPKNNQGDTGLQNETIGNQQTTLGRGSLLDATLHTTILETDVQTTGSKYARSVKYPNTTNIKLHSA